jgi:hypothetical protein
MVIKTMKLMMATALATATLVGTFIESVEAVSLRGKGNEATGGRITSDVDVIYNFYLYEITPTGDPRKDENRAPNIGKFTGAIENFTGTIIDRAEDNPNTPDGTFPDFRSANITTPSTLNLKAKLIPRKRIEYILSGESLANEGITELTLIIDDLDDDVFPDGIYEFEDIKKPKKAVNSINYIINQKLLGKINTIRVSSKTTTGGGGVDDFERIKAERIADRVVEVPESSTTNSLLALGGLGVGLFLRRKMK